MIEANVTERTGVQRTADRVFKQEAHWFFRTREGAPRGPFIDKQHAYWALAKYIRQQCSFR